ncbi:MAG: hypothetical protein WBH99_13480 [Azovibrio sp.]|uniref:ubiquinone biosynthesis accessory factor UbiJ n=1 Tax=Azovibrio sp. TaxID=1872673 RepID=UPI003C765573
MMLPMISSSLISRALNHLLQGAGWARLRLRPFAGQTLCIQPGPLTFYFGIGTEGNFHAVEAATTPEVSISLDASPLQLLLGPEMLMQQARISGNAEFAETLSFVFRNLEWDVEADLAPWLGDVPAHRLVLAGQTLKTHLQQSASRFSANVTEYLLHESHLLTPAPALQQFSTDLLNLRDDLARLEKRLQMLERR